MTDKRRTTQTFGADALGIAQAAELLSQGELVAFPTETVYGLGADARDGLAVAGIFAAKRRPQFNPLIVHVATPEVALRYGVWSDAARRVAQAFWPGPVTLVLPRRQDSELSPLVSAGLNTVAIRVPDHHVPRALLTSFGGPVAAPSANLSGRISPTRASHVLAGLTGRIAAVVDGGACGVGLESTIIGFDGPPMLLRPGGLPVEEIESVLGAPLAIRTPDARPSAPGQLRSHYAPRCAVRLNASSGRPGEVFVGFGPAHSAHTLSASGDLTEAAAKLFGMLHLLDSSGAKAIAVASIPEIGIGRAINDRLRRAAAPRDR